MHLSYFDADNKIDVHFLYSPYHELIGSLHVLAKYDHHMPREQWAINMIKKLSPEIKEKILLYKDITHQYLGLLNFLDNKDLWDISISECLYELEKVNIIDFFYLTFNGVINRQSIINAIKSNYYSDTMPSDYVECMKKPYDFREQILSFIREYYYNYFAMELSFSEPVLIRKLKKEYYRCKEISIYDYIKMLHPRIEVTDDRINFHKYRTFEVYKKDLQEAVFKIDSFINPHLLINIEAKKYIELIIPTYITSYDSDKLPADTLSVFKAIADETRMKIIRNLYREPMSTQKLADKLNLTEACISKHLKILFNASIVTKVRDGNYMNYHLDQMIIDSLVMYMYEYLN
ncbi:transcriptional regulator [Vallitalea longa]|uniref:Transcriptional regulator n=1 Tax=Vallitalea longa TaxID=2936439 RepID=A0A9W5YEW8_9FIRM|nr:metalloregulator ArsR/SmtB family transcription factor [Vallitalea longa]GKX31799.1 transcriptional regulator [Vallitalea longa]